MVPSSPKGRKATITLALALSAMLLGGCPFSRPESQASLVGHVQFPPARQVQATTAEIGTAATISLIDPGTSRTIATTLTAPDGTYTLTISGFTPQLKTYYLEAVKGLNSNLAGYDAARLRTLVRWSGSSWSALTTGNASLGVSTTALSAIVGLRSAYVPVNPDLLIGKLTIATPDVFVDAGTGVAQAEYTGVYDLVNQVLGSSRDPLDALQYDGSTYSLKTSTSISVRPYISLLTPNPASAGGQITVTGGNFRATLSENVLTLNGLTVTVLSGNTSSLVVRLPAGATSGSLNLTTTDGVATASMVITPGVDGSLLSSTASPLVPVGAGTDIPGSVFGR